MTFPTTPVSMRVCLEPRECDWCRGPIEPTARRDAITCSKRCRQARARFIAGVGSGSRDTSAPLRLAYADPPYPGLSAEYYEDHPDFAGEVDHAELIGRLCSDFDGWALSTNARSLQLVLALCPPDVRVASWHRGERPARAGQPLNGWEPVIYWGGRIDPDLSPVDGPRRVDTLEHFSRPRLTDPARVVGAKPAAFARWMFDLIGARPQDQFTDLFPGSGGILRAWHIYAGPPDPAALAAVDPH